MARSGPTIEWYSVSAMVGFALVILLGSLAILVTVLVVQPHKPYMLIKSANLNTIRYNQLALRNVHVSLAVEAHNDNSKSATFSGLSCRLTFASVAVSVFRVDGPFSVPAMGTVPLPYMARVQEAQLGDTGRATLAAAHRDGVYPFGLECEAKAHWKYVGVFSINGWTRLKCVILFFAPNGTSTAVDFTCTSKKHKLG